MKESLSVRFLYQTVPGRAILKQLVRPSVSKMVGKFLSMRISRMLIPGFLRSNHIDLSDIIIPKGGFSCFNDCFARKRKQVDYFGTLEELISPCDGFLDCISIQKNTIFDIKHTKFTLNDLLGNAELAKEFEDGMALVFRLTPANYHRYCYPATAKIKRRKRIEGVLHCVRPIVTSSIPVYVQNSREYQVLESENFGMFVQMEVGALLVGKIANNPKYKVGKMVSSGEEKGYFEFGGSTIILLLQKDAISLQERFCCRKDENHEVSVRQGEVIGYCIK